MAVGMGLTAWRLQAQVTVPAAGRPPRPRNVVVILADDVGWGDLSCYGATAVQTPQVDRLAREGVRFTDAQPLRHLHADALRAAHRRIRMAQKGTGIATGDAALLIEPGRTTLAAVFQRAGYVTGVVGKWHLGLGPGPGLTDWNKEVVPGPREIGFDYSFLIPATGDRTPCVYLENQRVVGLEPDDPIQVSFKLKEENYPGELDGRRDRSQLKMDWDYGHHFAVVNGIGRIGYMAGGKRARWVDEEMATRLRRKARRSSRATRTSRSSCISPRTTFMCRACRIRGLSAKQSMGPRGDAIVQFDFQVGAILDALDALGWL
jgi:hypothetical protein